jgi:hypothetical protein
MDDLKAVSSVLDTAGTVEIQVLCKVYSKRNGELVSTANTGIIKKGKMNVSVFDDLEIFTNDQYGVYVNSESKSIMLISKSKHTSRLKAPDDKGLDKFVSWVKQQQNKAAFNPDLLSDEAGVRTYSIRGVEDLKEVLVSINTKNKTVVRISYEFSDSSQQKQRYIVLDYSKFLVNSKETSLNQKDYYIQQSGKFLPGNKYKSYSITTDL